MPIRKESFGNDEMYHVFNRGIDRRIIFKNSRDYERALTTCDFYRFIQVRIPLSEFIRSSLKAQKEIRLSANKAGSLVEILAYCFMPNHFHFLLRQKVDGGISKFMSNFQNSYTRYSNLKNKRSGPLLSTQFRAVKIDTEDELVHVNRYIHLNPYTSYIVKSFDELKNYSWSSLREYLNPNEKNICQMEEVLGLFKNSDDYLQFVLDQAEYQKELKKIKDWQRIKNG